MSRAKGVSKHDLEAQPRSKKKNNGRTHLGYYAGKATCWCFVCSSEHRWGEPCQTDGTSA